MSRPPTARDAVAGTVAPLPAPPRPASPVLVRYLDLAVLVALLPVFLLAGLPVLGWVVGAVLYAGQRALSGYLERRAQATDDLRARVGLLAGGMVGRGYLVALALLGVYFALGRDVALGAAILFLAAFTVYFALTLFLRPARRATPPR